MADDGIHLAGNDAAQGSAGAPEQLWVETICRGLQGTGLDLTINVDRRMTEESPPMIGFYANFGDTRSIMLPRRERVALSSGKVSLVSLDGETAVTEHWRSGQRAVTAGIMLGTDLAEALPEPDAEELHCFFRKWCARPGAFELPQSPRLTALAERILDRPAGSGWIAALERQQIMLTFLLEAVRLADNREQAGRCVFDSRCAGRLDDVACCLARIEDSPPDLARLAREAGMSLSVLRRRFKARFGETLSDFARRHRLEHALTLLESGGLSISQVAWQAGYADTANFSTAFRRHFGFTPGSARG